MEYTTTDPQCTKTGCTNGFILACSEKDSSGTSADDLLGTAQDDDAVPTADVSTLMQLLKNIYDQKILSVENNIDFDESMKNQKKLLLLQRYVHQLLEQNDTFASTMMELETEAQHRVKLMEKRLKSSAKTTMEAVINVHELEKEMRRIVDEKIEIESHYSDMEQLISSIKVENGFLRDQNCNLSHDVQALLHIIQHARSTGHWEMDCVTFCEVTPEQVFGPIQSISNKYSSDSPQLEFGVFGGFNKNVPLFPPDEMSSALSLQKCISLPDIGNIYTFPNVRRRHFSYNTLRHTQFRASPTDATQLQTGNCVHPKLHEERASESRKCAYSAKTIEQTPHIRKGHSEPHLFMFDNNIYAYKPCEDIKKPADTALHDNFDMGIPPCISIDLKFPTEESNSSVCFWSSPKTGSHIVSKSSCCFRNGDSCYSCTCSDPDHKELNAECCCERVSSGAQTEKPVSFSIGLQAAIKRDGDFCDMCSCHDPGVHSFDVNLMKNLLQNHESDVSTDQTLNSGEDQVEGALSKYHVGNGSLEMDIPKVMNVVQSLKESLTKAENKAEAKEILIAELQNHLTSIVKETDSNKEKIEEILSEQNVLQEQKRALLIRLDTQEDELESTKNELRHFKHKADVCALQVEQQSHIIRNLQEALVQSKRAFDAAQKTSLLPAPSNFAAAETNSASKRPIVDI